MQQIRVLMTHPAAFMFEVATHPHFPTSLQCTWGAPVYFWHYIPGAPKTQWV